MERCKVSNWNYVLFLKW